jgi:tetratricopeptide (TPR) repeat protein
MKRWTLCVGIALALAAGRGEAAGLIGTVGGTVLDGDRTPVVGATVVVASVRGTETYTSKTRKDGTFVQITSGTSGPWRITVSKEGHRTWETPDPVLVQLGGEAVALPAVTLWKSDDPRAPVSLSPEAMKQLEAERKEFGALAAEYDGAVGMMEAADAAQQAGNTALVAEKLQGAQAVLNSLIEKHPSVAMLRLTLGLVYEKKHDWESAATVYLKAVELKPDGIDAYRSAAPMFLNLRQLPKAVEVCENGLKVSPGDPRLLFLLALARYNEGNYPAALAAFEKAKQANPTDAESYYYLGTIAVAQNRVADCLALLQKYVAMNPTNARNLKSAQDMLAALAPKKK